MLVTNTVANCAYLCILQYIHQKEEQTFLPKFIFEDVQVNSYTLFMLCIYVSICTHLPTNDTIKHRDNGASVNIVLSIVVVLLCV